MNAIVVHCLYEDLAYVCSCVVALERCEGELVAIKLPLLWCFRWGINVVPSDRQERLASVGGPSVKSE
jgi:hypothetical protein